MSNSLLASKCVVRCTLSLVLSEVIDCVHVHWRKKCFSGFKTTKRNITGWNQNKQRVARANEIANENVHTNAARAREREKGSEK